METQSKSHLDSNYFHRDQSQYLFFVFCSENQGPRVAREIEGRSPQPAQGSQGGARPPPRRQGHRRCPQQALQDQGGEARDRAGADGDLTKAEGSAKGGLQSCLMIFVNLFCGAS